jgi:hypothetical protein
MSDTKAPHKENEVGVVVERKSEGSTSYSGVLYASAILSDKVPPGTKLYVAAPDHGADDLNMAKVPMELLLRIALPSTTTDKNNALSELRALLAGGDQ